MPAAVSKPATAPPPRDELAARPRGTDVATFFNPYCASWDWLCQYLGDEPLVRHEGEGPLPAVETAAGK